MEGWIKLYRKFKDWEWYNISEMVQLFIHLLLNANREPGEWRGIIIERGQLITGRKILSENTGIPEQTVRTCLNRLKSTNEITIKVTNKYSIITICNYEDYQNGSGTTNQQISQQTNQQLTNNQPTTNQQLTTNKNNKEEKEYKEDIQKRKSDFENYVFEYDPLKYSQELLKDFCSYWTEKNKKGDKMRFEAEKFFDIGRRLATWNKNNSKFSKDKYEPEIIRTVFRPYPTK